MKIFNGKKEADKIISVLRKKIKKERRKPFLAVIWVGDNVSSKIFVRNKKRIAKKIGAKISVFRFKKSVKEKDLINKIKALNKDSSVNGIIVQLPLPSGLNTDRIVNSVSPHKDVDGFHKENRRLLKTGKQFFNPILPSIIYSILKDNLKNKRNIFALVNSDVFGKTLKDFLDKKKIKIRYIKKGDKMLGIKKADAIISVRGVPGLIKGDMIKEGVCLIDAGSLIFKNKIIGDIDRKSVGDKPSFLTPVPGGVGPVNVALLFKNLYLAFKKYGSR